ncbi:class I SAM-dependent methyltransferase [Candidatus Peregrinibacteria bacterium]|nr:class I SAM-dependent methyltransferase [Candidatus Peregrinibacteria bacterium]
MIPGPTDSSQEKAREAADFEWAAEHLPEERKATYHKEIGELIFFGRRAFRAIMKKKSLSKYYFSLLHKDKLKEDVMTCLESDRPLEYKRKKLKDLLREARGERWAQIEELGGSTRRATLRVLKRYDELEHTWFAEVFDELEARSFADYVLPLINIPPEEIMALDIGSGAGRASLVFLEAVRKRYGDDAVARFAPNIHAVDPEARKKRYGDDAVARFAPNIHAVDLMPRFVGTTRKKLTPKGVLPQNIKQGDFLSLPEEFRQGKFHLAYALFHTFFHCTTERELRTALRNVEEALAEGGIFVVDSVGIYDIHYVDQERLKGWDDLKNLYSILVLMYREARLDPILPPDQREGHELRRYPIEDGTTGAGTYTREVLTRDYLKHVLRKMGSALSVVSPLSPIQLLRQDYPEDKARELGRQWISQNRMEEWLRREIAFRLPQLDRGDAALKPFYSLSPEQKERQKMGLKLDDPRIGERMGYLATELVRQYVQKYYILKKGKRG